MNRIGTSLLAVFALVVIAGSASAALRVPQVAVTGGTSGVLQSYLNSVGESINVTTDQVDAQRWASTVSTNSTFTIQVELGTFAPANGIGIYNASDPAAVPPLYQVFPGAATAGWFAVASFRSLPTRVTVNLFDNNAALVGSTIYLGADRLDFGFWLHGPGGLYFSQDARNPGGLPHALAFAGTGLNSGSWWLGLEEAGDATFADAVLFMESINPTPVAKTTWGSLKARFR
jgi:hypothetical protein